MEASNMEASNMEASNMEASKREASKREASKREASRPDAWLGMRHFQTTLMFLGILVGYTLRVNLSVAIVAMVDKEAANPDYPEYDWDESTKGIILSSFFWGYVITQIPAGQLAQRYGAKPLLVISLSVASVFSILTPGAAAWGGWQMVCAFRVIQGLAQGFLFPCTHTLLSKWAPDAERGTLATYVYAGAQLGTVLALPVCGLLATSAAGWPSTFYVFGGLGLGWALLWLALGSNSPAEDRLISAQERAYIEDSLRTSDKPSQPLSTPWKAMLTSLPMWAIVVANCGHGWGFWTLLTEMPSYTNSVTYLFFQPLSTPWKAMLTSLPMWAIVVANCGHGWGFWTLLTEMPSYMNSVTYLFFQPLSTPWKAMLTSLPMWAIVVANCGHGWGFWTLLTEMPSYMNSVTYLFFQPLSTPWKAMLTSLPMWAIVVANCGHGWGFWTLLTEMPSYTNSVTYLFFQPLSTPWKAMLTSLPMWAIVVANCGHGWGFWTLLTEMPSYMNSVTYLFFQPLSTPWKAMLTSLPMWAIVVANCGHGWGFWTLLTEMPSYMNSVTYLFFQPLSTPWKAMLTSLPMWAIVVANCGHGWGFWTLLTEMPSYMNSVTYLFFQPLSTPWKAMLTSLPMWAIVVANCGHGWGFWTLLTEMPSYMNSVLGFDLKSNGLLSALPYLMMFALSFVFSLVSDHVTNNHLLHKTTARRLFNSIGLLGPAVTLVGVAYATDATVAIALLTVAVGLNSAIYVGFNVNHIDLAPNFAGVMMGIANGLANVMSIIGPLVVGVVVQDAGSTSQWRIVFFIAAGIYIVTGVFYALCADAELQWWNECAPLSDVTLSPNTLNNNISNNNEKKSSSDAAAHYGATTLARKLSE